MTPEGKLKYESFEWGMTKRFYERGTQLDAEDPLVKLKWSNEEMDDEGDSTSSDNWDGLNRNSPNRSWIDNITGANMNTMANNTMSVLDQV